MISKRYVIAVVPNGNFIGPLTSESTEGNNRYIREFRISIPNGNDSSRRNFAGKGYSKLFSQAIESGDVDLALNLRVQFERSKLEGLPQVRESYTDNPSKARLFDRIEADLASFILGGVVNRGDYSFVVEESHAFEHSLVH